MLRPRLEWLLAFVPVVVALELLHGPPTAVFVTAALAIVPLAGLIGTATEELALHSGPQVGGLLNATFGNITELIVAILLIAEGEIEIVKASLTGSILGNILLVLGLAFLVGGWGREEQTFSRHSANLYTAALLIAVGGLLLPALFSLTPHSTGLDEESVSVGVAIVLVMVYFANLLFYLRTHRSLFHTTVEGEPRWTRSRAVSTLAASVALVALISEFLVGAIEPAVEDFGISRIFVGLIVIPIIGNAAEHGAAVTLAAKDRIAISLEIAIGSSAQIALFVAPILVFVSLALGNPMDFVFSGIEVAAVGLSVLILGFIVADGRSNWLEGAQLLATYLIMAVAFFFL